MRRLLPLVILLTLALNAKTKLSDEERIEIIRGLSSEHATAKTTIPRSRKPLVVESEGAKWDKSAWDDAMKEFGPAARSGELVRVTKITIEDDRILFEINGGLKANKKWYERVEVGMGGAGTPIGRADQVATAGTNLALKFPEKMHDIDSAKIKLLLKPILDFDKQSVTENYVDTLPEPVKIAIKEKRAIEGMDREQVIMALGRPRNKERRTDDGTELEEWVYGQAPGKISFITFANGKVTKVKDSYAGLGGSTAPNLPVQ